jgi:hypothetical protein
MPQQRVRNLSILANVMRNCCEKERKISCEQTDSETHTETGIHRRVKHTPLLRSRVLIEEKYQTNDYEPDSAEY